MSKCMDCENFKILYPPMGHYDSGMAKCNKHDLVVDFFANRS